eukprot:11577277-Ditylum_brightwellii.AAC.1
MDFKASEVIPEGPSTFLFAILRRAARTSAREGSSARAVRSRWWRMYLTVQISYKFWLVPT